MMRAIQAKEFGGPEVLKLAQLALPKIGENQVLVKMAYAGVNPVDTYIRSGTYAIRPELPYVPGGDGAGVVTQIGKNVTHLLPNQRVFFALDSGSYAEYAVVEQRNVFPLGNELSFSQGASIGVPYFTAYRALIQKARAKPGEVVLVHGATGGVGLAAVQLAKSLGMTVIGTAGTKDGEELVRKNGAHHVYSHKRSDYIEGIKAVTQGRGVDVVLEMLANVNLVKSCGLLAQNGRLIVIGSRGSIEFEPRLLMPKELSIIGVALRAPTESEWKEIGAAICGGVETGWVKPVVDKEYPLENASQAHHDIINSTGAKGNLVLKVSQN